jgi:hypothetical protein
MKTTAFFHVVAGILLTASVFFFGLGIRFFRVIAQEVYDQLPKSRWSWFAAHSLLLHREFYPDSPLRKDYWFCGFAAIACCFLGFYFWMK